MNSYNFIEGVGGAIFSAVSDRLSLNAASSAIENCCKHLGWNIHSRTNDGRVYLHFADPLVETRVVMASITDRGACVSFMVMSPVTMLAKEVPASVLGYMLERNVEPFVLWQVAVGNDGSALFTLNYRVPTSGLQPWVFRILCETMTAEALAFDSRMHKLGLLQTTRGSFSDDI